MPKSRMMLKVTKRTWKPTVRPETIEGRTVYFAMHPGLLGVIAQGETEQEAVEAFAENLNHFLEHMKAVNLDVPRPTHIEFVMKLDKTHQGEGSGAEVISVHPVGPLVLA